MRRVLSAFLVSVFSYSLIGPALFASADSNVPACCRRDGKHHCSMSGMDQDTSMAPPGLSLAAFSAKCSYFPKGGALLPHSDAAVGVTFAACRSVITVHATLRLTADASYCAAFGRAHGKRGPPSLSLHTLAV